MNPPGCAGVVKYCPLHVFTYTSPFALTAMWRAWPIVSANIVAQNPAGSVIPPLSFAHALVDATVEEAVLDCAALPPSPLLQPLKATTSDRAHQRVSDLGIPELGIMLTFM